VLSFASLMSPGGKPSVGREVTVYKIDMSEFYGRCFDLLKHPL